MNKSFVLPELLLHPNIPKPLHGVNPRSILGQQWWDVISVTSYQLPRKKGFKPPPLRIKIKIFLISSYCLKAVVTGNW